MDVAFKQRVDQLVTDISNITSLTTKVEVLNYVMQQADFLLWQLEDEQRIDEDSRDY
ncbi:MAG: hypothetical protein K6F85_03015 [Bacteroidales bacterium]|nr:hypothetical protein [Bacteroidales bacterium]